MAFDPESFHLLIFAIPFGPRVAALKPSFWEFTVYEIIKLPRFGPDKILRISLYFVRVLR